MKTLFHACLNINIELLKFNGRGSATITCVHSNLLVNSFQNFCPLNPPDLYIRGVFAMSVPLAPQS